MLPADYLTTLRLDPTLPAPLFRQLYDHIKQAILAGRLAPGVQLPPTREMAQLLSVSRQTILNAYAQLMAEGFLNGTVGRGTFVSSALPAPEQKRARLAREQPAQPVPPAQQALSLLSARGQAFVQPQSRLNVHYGPARAFRLGMPALDLFPFSVWARLEARRWRRPQHPLGYDEAAGFMPLRQALATYLRAARGVQCEAEQVIVTSGSQQALFLIASLLLDPGDQAWVEQPGYRGMQAALRATQAQVCPVPVDDEGLSVSTGCVRFPKARLAYVTPSHQLPLGVTMSLSRRLELLAWAARQRAWIVEDDYDSEYRYTGPPLASLQSLDKAGCVLYTGTLSKILFPALRLGYLVVPPAMTETFIQAKAILDRHTPTVPQMVLSDFILEGHFHRHIKRTREAYAERRAELLDGLQQFEDVLACGTSDAGLHCVARLREPRSDKLLVQRGEANGLELRALSQFCISNAQSEAYPSCLSGLVLGFAAITPGEIRHGLVSLRQLFDKVG